MEVFKLRLELMEKFKKGSIDLTTLSGETFRAIKESRDLGSSSPSTILEKAYFDYLISLCKLERRVNFEYRLLKSNLSDQSSYQRVAAFHFSEMSKAVLDILKKSGENSVNDLMIGPKGIVIIDIKNSPIGRVYFSRSAFIDSEIKERPNKLSDHPYLKALFSFA